MGRGFLAGIFWGGIVGLALLVVSSQTLDRQQLSFPRPEASPVEVPGGSEFDQARPEMDPVVPQPETRPEAEVASGVEPPADAVETPPTFDTSALEVPTPAIEPPGGLGAAPQSTEDSPATPAISDSDQHDKTGAALPVPETPADAPATETQSPAAVGTPDAGSDAPPDVGSTVEAPVDTEVAVLPQVETEDLSRADTGTAPRISSGDTPPVAPVSPEVGGEPSLPVPTDEPTAPRLPQVTNEPSLPASGGDAPDVADAPAAPSVLEPETGAGTVNVDGSDSSFFEPVESFVEQDAGDDAVRLPQIGDGSGDLPTVLRPGEDGDETDAPTVAEDAAAGPGGPALLAYRSEFENPEGNPLLSIILIQDGPLLSEDQLGGLPRHVAFAIDAGESGAAEAAAFYRAADREVVLIPALPQGARPQDVEQALRVNFETVPEAIAVMDVSGGRFQTDRAAVSQVVDVVSATGHGLITFPRGLNTVHQRAERAGVPTGLIFRDLDGGGETSEQIRRTLDRAAFRARQEDAVILVGTTAETTLGAIVEWSMGIRSSSVTIAPVSSSLLSD